MRLLAVAALAGPAIMIGSPNAHATIHRYPARDGTCVGGPEILRCLELRYDDVNRRYRAWAWIIDVAGGADARVKIGSVSVSPPGGSLPNLDWQEVRDDFASSLEPCIGRPLLVGFQATYSWRIKATGAEGHQLRSGTVTICQ
ncbi:hypothetical protein [Spirillospora sp. NPDC047279]|uniref:hypothetical protein n=1 Tax=Spirillospora sp. NPDC047279 TaxID=3155478 RepID=UPI0033C57A7C